MVSYAILFLTAEQNYYATELPDPISDLKTKLYFPFLVNMFKLKLDKNW